MHTLLILLPDNPRFALGDLFCTPGVQQAIPSQELSVALKRHLSGDWGELGPEDKQANDRSLEVGARLLSSYRSASGKKFWIITEANRSSTTLLFPEEY